MIICSDSVIINNSRWGLISDRDLEQSIGKQGKNSIFIRMKPKQIYEIPETLRGYGLLLIILFIKLADERIQPSKIKENWLYQYIGQKLTISYFDYFID